ncbi:hypothetical protein ACH5RR_006753 [Cinchona calisaya]|uniref:Protein kinase domain-containing protein n=1 Tax=Cinchona calisaya TaxID=153742 RepID=A0ABD3AQ83_9GENT
MLNKSKANRQEFINEVAPIGRIHHINMVRLVGFCVIVSKDALVFDYMPNSSLDKFIFSECSNGFVPKASDFGLAKLYPIQDCCLETLTIARGTIGYMSPKLLYRKVGRVSYEANVYSYGMLLIEMVGRRKNVNVLVKHSSQIYFSSWIYDELDVGEDVKIGDHVTEEEKGFARQLILTAL